MSGKQLFPAFFLFRSFLTCLGLMYVLGLVCSEIQTLTGLGMHWLPVHHILLHRRLAGLVEVRRRQALPVHGQGQHAFPRYVLFLAATGPLLICFPSCHLPGLRARDRRELEPGQQHLDHVSCPLVCLPAF